MISTSQTPENSRTSNLAANVSLADTNPACFYDPFAAKWNLVFQPYGQGVGNRSPASAGQDSHGLSQVGRNAAVELAGMKR